MSEEIKKEAQDTELNKEENNAIKCIERNIPYDQSTQPGHRRVTARC